MDQNDPDRRAIGYSDPAECSVCLDEAEVPHA